MLLQHFQIWGWFGVIMGLDLPALQQKIIKTNKNLLFNGHVFGMSSACYIVLSIWSNFRLKINNGLQCQCNIIVLYCYNSTCNYRDHFQQYILASCWSYFNMSFGCPLVCLLIWFCPTLPINILTPCPPPVCRMACSKHVQNMFPTSMYVVMGLLFPGVPGGLLSI